MQLEREVSRRSFVKGLVTSPLALSLLSAVLCGAASAEYGRRARALNDSVNQDVRMPSNETVAKAKSVLTDVSKATLDDLKDAHAVMVETETLQPRKAELIREGSGELRPSGSLLAVSLVGTVVNLFRVLGKAYGGEEF